MIAEQQKLYKVITFDRLFSLTKLFFNKLVQSVLIVVFLISFSF